jgi:predicted CXXCH cytochrome family protein
MEILSSRLHHVFILHEFLLALFVIFFSVLFEAFSQHLQAEESPDNSNCTQCHNDIYEANLSMTNVHPPFLQQECSVCHVDDGTAMEEEVYATSMKNIDWLGANFTPAVKHWFNIPIELVSSDRLIMVAGDNLGKSYEEVLPLPAFEMIQQLVDESIPYIITPEVLGVYRGILITARIGWTTKEESDSEVRYGLDTLRYSVGGDEFTTDHEIVLQNLKSNQNYQYIVISQDIFGNRTESEVAYFSTENFSPAPLMEYEQDQEADILLEAQFFRNGDSYLVMITANQPVTLKVGTEIINAEDEEVLESLIADNPDHLPMRSRNDIYISVCMNCHANIFNFVSHPINVGPSPEMTFPDNYRTNSAGNITCITCHANHASNFRYRTVKSASLELCVGCHKGYDNSPEQRSGTILMVNK